MTSIDTRDRLVGRGGFIQPRPPARFEWDNVFQNPPGQNSILVQSDGTVTEGVNFTTTQIRSAYAYIQGGHDWRDDGDAWLRGVLEDAGYTFESVT